MASNAGAVLTAVKAPLEVKAVDLPTAGENEIVVKTRAVAINPVDWGMQAYGPAVFQWLELPLVIGEDLAGEVESVGSAVTRFKVGDRVAALSRAAFQEHVAVREHLALGIPPSISYEEAAVLPMGLSVAAKGLFHNDFLGLQLPSLNPKHTGETILIWGASTSVGSNAVQLAKAAGYEVIATASEANLDRAKQLGASQVFDYKSPTIKEDLVEAFRGKKSPGAFCNGPPSREAHPPIIAACSAVVSVTEGRKFLALTMVPPPGGLPEGVEGKFVEPLENDVELATTIFGDFATKVLANGTYVASPKPKVVGKGLEAIQGAIDKLAEGVSATKLVVTL